MSKWLKFLTILSVLALVMAACTPPQQATEGPGDATEEATEAAGDDGGDDSGDDGGDDGASEGEPVTIRWFVGLGTGGNPEQIAAQEEVVADFNESHDDIELVIEIVENEVASNVLATQLAAGEGPDIIGPAGFIGLLTFKENLLDITPYIESTGYDLSTIDPGLVDAYKIGPQGGQAGLPFAVFPSALWYNEDLFDEAGLPYPPANYGEPYVNADGEEVEWDMDALRDLGMQLTVDAEGNTPLDEGFDAENIVQFGFDFTFTPGRGRAVLFGGCEMAQADGTAQICDHWREAWKWHYDAMWTDHWMPNDSYAASDLLAQGNTFSSGNIAMMPQNLWYTCCLPEELNWNVGAIPTYNGVATAKLHADTFAVLNNTENPEAAFEVLTYLLSPEVALKLLPVYGGFPANTTLQDQFQAEFLERFPGVNFEAFLAGLEHVDTPNHEALMPNYAVADERLNAFQTLYGSTPDLDMDEELDKLEADLSVIFGDAE
jgi:multiple sugar transport system substrate-binding protein